MSEDLRFGRKDFTAVLPFTMGDDASRKINTGNEARICRGDLPIFGKAFSAADMEKLAAYYEFQLQIHS